MNGVTGSSAATAAGAVAGSGLAGTSGAMGRDDFLQLLVAQLKNQDPMNPSSPEEFAAQLAQFSSLEQLLNIEETLESQGGLQEALLREINSGTAMSLLGRDVLAAGDSVDVTGDPEQSVTVGVGGAGGEATLRILDEEGQVVGSRPVGFVPPGRQDIALAEAAEGLEAGRYTYELEVRNGETGSAEVQTFSRYVVDGVRYGPDGPIIMSGDTEISLADVIEVARAANANPSNN